MAWAVARGPGAPSRPPSRAPSWAPWGGGGGGRAASLLLLAATLCLVRGRGVGPPPPEHPVGSGLGPRLGPGPAPIQRPAQPHGQPNDGLVYVAVALPGAQDPTMARIVHRTLANMTKDFLNVSTVHFP